MKTVAYLRISTGAQDLNAQKLAILEFARKENIHVNDFIETTVSSGSRHYHSMAERSFFP